MGMAILFLVLAIGGVGGWLARDSARTVDLNRHLTRATLWALLFVMGAKLALNRGLFAKDLRVFFAAIGSSLLLVGVFFILFLLVDLLRGRRPGSSSTVEANPEDKGGHELTAVALNSGCIAAGFLLFFLLPAPVAAHIPVDPIGEWVLRALLLFIGFDLGVELHRLDLRKLPPLLLLVPFVNILVSLGCGLLFSLLTRHSAREGLLLYSGLGWYSLSSVLLAERGLMLLSILAFIHNVFRELLAILCAPLAARVSPYLPIYLGGATSMDVMLPFVQRYCGRQYTLVSFYSGVICSLAVIPLVRLIAGN